MRTASPTRVGTITNWIFGLFCALTGLSIAFQFQSDYATRLSPLAPVLFVAFVVLWVARQRVRSASRRRLVALAIAAVGIGLASSVDGLGALPTIFLTTLVVALDVSVVAAFAVDLILVLVEVVIMRTVHGQTTISALVQGLGMLLFATFGLGFAWIIREFSDQQEQLAAANAELAHSNGQLAETNVLLEQANEKLFSAMESQAELVLAEERSRAARELHDGLGHQFTTMGMSLDFALATRDKDATRAWAEVERARRGVAQALADMRLWVRALSPAQPGDGTAGLNAIAQSFRDTGLDVQVSEVGEEALSQRQALFAYRFVQEGLTNALRHGNPSRVQISLVNTGDGVHVEVVDDGTTAAEHDVLADGFGLRSLRERAEALGGRVEARRRNPGFVLAAHLPQEAA